MQKATCKNCGREIVRLADDRPWQHAMRDIPLPMGRGCRSASYSRDGDWDEALNRAWKATPDRATIRVIQPLERKFALTVMVDSATLSASPTDEAEQVVWDRLESLLKPLGIRVVRVEEG